MDQTPKFLDDVDLASDGSPNPTDQQIQSERKSNWKSTIKIWLTKARNEIYPVQVC
jgi:hypothetical protein